MKKFFAVTLMLLSSSIVFSQFDAQIGHYMYLNGAFNPAAVGKESGFMEVTGAHRIGWMGVPNAGQTTFFQFQLPFSIGKTNHGAGVRFINENVGLFSNKMAHLQYNYKFDLGNGTLSAGIELGFMSIGFKGDSVRDVNSDYHDLLGDVHIPQSKEEDMDFDMSLGAYYTHSKWYAGISYSHLTTPKMQWGDESDFTIKGIMYMTAGYNFKLSNPIFTIKPSTLIRTDFVSWQWEVSAILDYKEKYRGGLSYRYQDAIGILLGMDIISGFSIGYTYEIPISKIGGWGAHELFLTYGFNILKQKKNSKYKNVRIL